MSDHDLTELQLFTLGRVLAAPGALAVFVDAKQSPREFILRHVTGDWGELDPDDVLANRHAVELGLRILLAYRTSDGVKMWIITEADRLATALLLPEEY